MRVVYLLAFLLLQQFQAIGQNPNGFDQMIQRMVKGTVPFISSEGLQEILQDEVYILDTREREEYEVSHITGSTYVGYKDLDMDFLKSIPLGSTIVTYCSIGYRSEKVGLRLMSLGQQNVFNLKGGIFDWANNGYIVTSKGWSTEVHGYNKKWSKWLNPNKITPVLELKEH